MFFSEASVDVMARIVLLGPVALAWVIVLVRVIGLRAFSKLTAFDFIVTLATGSLLASAASSASWSAYAQALGAMTALLATQVVLAKLRERSPAVRNLLENDPVLIVHEGRMLRTAMRRNRISAADIHAKLRENDVADLDDVCAVVLEPTGDISVLTAPASPATLREVLGTD